MNCQNRRKCLEKTFITALCFVSEKPPVESIVLGFIRGMEACRARAIYESCTTHIVKSLQQDRRSSQRLHRLTLQVVLQCQMCTRLQLISCEVSASWNLDFGRCIPGGSLSKFFRAKQPKSVQSFMRDKLSGTHTSSTLEKTTSAQLDIGSFPGNETLEPTE